MISNQKKFLIASRLVVGILTSVVVSFAHATGSYAYIYAPGVSGGTDTVALEFESLLDGRGYATDLISMADAGSTDFSFYRKVLIGDNTGSLNEWGTAALAAHINSYGKPIVGIGEGGYAFFGLTGSKLGWPNGWHGPEDTWVVTNPSHQVFNLPNGISLGVGNTVQVLTTASNEVGISRQVSRLDSMDWAENQRRMTIMDSHCRMIRISFGVSVLHPLNSPQLAMTYSLMWLPIQYLNRRPMP